jgi:hypothetical protein
MDQRGTRWADSMKFDMGVFYENLTRKRKFV